MARPIITIPVKLRRDMQFNWRIEWRGVDNGTSLSGNSAWVVNQKPRWIGTPTFAARRTMIGAWQALMAQLQGRHGILQVEIINTAAMPALAARSTGLTFSNGQYLSTGSGVAYVPTVLSVGAAYKGATSIKVHTSDFPPVQGQIMSYAKKPFQVTYVDDLGGGDYEVGVQRLATDIPDDAEIRCVGVGLFELSDEGQGAITYGPSHFATPAPQLQEVLNA